jgi:hypothetical protein
MFCILCRSEIDPTRARRGGVTCSPNCALEVNRLRRAMSAQARCRLCGRRFRTRKPVERVSGPTKGVRAPDPEESKFTPVRTPHNHVAGTV